MYLSETWNAEYLKHFLTIRKDLQASYNLIYEPQLWCLEYLEYLE